MSWSDFFKIVNLRNSFNENYLLLILKEAAGVKAIQRLSGSNIDFGEEETLYCNKSIFARLRKGEDFNGIGKRVISLVR